MRNVFVFVLCLLAVFYIGNIEDPSIGLENYSFYSKSNSNALLVNSTGLKRKINTVDSIVDSTVSIQILTENGFAPFGTGVIVTTPKGPVLVTAKHVSLAFYPAPLYACSIRNPSSCINIGSSFIMMTESPENHGISMDWAVYKLVKLPEGSSPIRISRQTVGLGEPLWFVGMPWGRSPSISKGVVSWKETSKTGGLIHATGFAAPGFSGGPVCNEKGELVGITVAIVKTPEGKPQVNQILVVPLGNLWFL